jgi:4-oxalocrotonate tautomerase
MDRRQSRSQVLEGFDEEAAVRFLQVHKKGKIPGTANESDPRYGGEIMPVVIVEMWEGRTPDQKETLIKGITKAFEGIGVKPESLHIVIHDISKTNWGTRGQQASKLQ